MLITVGALMTALIIHNESQMLPFFMKVLMNSTSINSYTGSSIKL